MYEDTLVGVVIPAYNEEGFIGEAIESVPEFVDRIYAVDDCSTDGTWEEITSCAPASRAADTAADGLEMTRADGGVTDSGVARSDPEHGRTLVPVRHARNRGRGGAVKTGYQLALTDGIDVVAVMDGDGQMDGAILDRMLDPVVNGEADYAKGNRLVGPETWQQMSRWRLFGNFLLTSVTMVASGYYGVRDPQNGYTAVSAETLEDMAVEQLYEGYGFLNDMLVRLNRHDKRVTDVPMKAIYADEESGIRYRSFVPWLSWLLVRMYLWRVWAMVRGVARPTSAGSAG